MTIPKDEERYNMNHGQRGICLVFNQEKFVKLEKREGSSVDVERIKSTFGRLGFNVVVHKDLKFLGVTKEIEILRELEHKDNDCVCVFVLTHGEKSDYLLASDDVAYPSDEIWKPFIADMCPSLAGKPKLFFFQTCRGKETDHGVEIKNSSARHQTDAIVSTTPSYTLPKLADFLIAHSSMDGFPSYRDINAGTWYVQTLCDVLDQFGASKDLLKMLTITARRVATEYQSCNYEEPKLDKQKQVPTVMSTLIRDLYFTSE